MTHALYIFIGILSLILGNKLGFRRGKTVGYETGYRDGRISCARNKGVAPTHLRTAEVVKSRKLEEDAMEWLG
jgi:hypothetical protein